MLMKVDRDELERVVGLAASAAKPKSDIVILSQLLLIAAPHGCTLRGCDTEIDITAPFAAEVSHPGQICVGARLLQSIVKRLPAGQPVSLTLKDGKLKIVCGRSRFELSTLPTDDYPLFSERGSQVHQFEVEADLFSRLLAAVRHCQSKDETRYYLCGIHLHVTQEEPVKLIAVATNGHVLAKESMLAPVGAYGMPKVILPAGTVGEMLKLLPDKGQLVTLSVSERLIWLDRPDGLSMGNYPDYERVIPRANKHSIRCDADSLAIAVGRVATICDADHKEISLSIDPRGGVTVISERLEIGVGRDKIDNVEVSGPKRVLSFNHKYLTAMLSSYAGGQIELRYADAADPTLITIAGSDDGLQVLMPMRTNSREALSEAKAA
jgi:DNA polymerase-3 subunit beta